MTTARPHTVRDFLLGLGLEQYAATFDEQAIDLELLPDLTEAQLEQLGVQMLGHRLKLLRAAATLRAAAAESMASAPAPRAAHAPPPAGAPGTSPERRQLTVLFCDLVGSTALSQQFDPEDLRALMQSYRGAASTVIAAHGGHVAQLLGDGLMVYFGWPRAHEDDAQRAVAAALKIVEATAAIAAPQPLRVRIGIATGSVVVGEASGDVGDARLAVGETPNLAARVQGQAEPDQVLVADATHRLLGRAFDTQALGERALKGIGAPVRLWRILGERGGEARFAVDRGDGRTKLVNRELEMALLRARWGHVREGRGQAVLLLGEAGIGKSRILSELCDRVAEDSLQMRLQCASLYADTAFHPVAAHLLRAAGIGRLDSADVRWAKLEAYLEQIGTPPETQAPLFGALLAWPPGRRPPPAVSPSKLRSLAIEAYVAALRDAARRRPLVLVVEDLHWADPSTLDLLQACVAGLKSVPVLLLMTSRETPAGRWAPGAVTPLGLSGLSRDHSLELAHAVAAGHGLDRALVQRIVERTDGVPLFLEELTRTMGERGGQAGELPATLKASLTARLDALGPARRALQLGAVQGRLFRLAPLQALLGADEVAAGLPLQAALDRAGHAGLISASGSAPDLSYTFHHALTQDAAYESLLKSERRALHVRLADWLRGQQAEAADVEPEVLARHYSAGEAWDHAAPLWLKAGQGAWARGAAQEAVTHLEAGVAAVARMPPAAQRDLLEVQLQSQLGLVWFAARSYTAPQAQAAFARAAQLCERLDDATLKVPVLLGVGTYQVMKGDAQAGHATFEAMGRLTDTVREPRLQLAAHAALTWTRSTLGLHDEALRASDICRRLSDAGAASQPRLSASGPRVLSECFRAVSLWALGRVDEARDTSEGLMQLARALDPYSLTYALTFAALPVAEYCGDVEVVLDRTEEGIAMAHELGYPFLVASATVRRGWALGLAGAVTDGLALLEEGLAQMESQGVGFGRAVFLAWRARLQLRMGEFAAAQRSVEQARGHLESSSNLVLAPDVLLAEGEVQLALGSVPRARRSFEAALEAARRQAAHSWSLRSGTALARLVADDQGPSAAHALLHPLADAIQGGAGTTDVDTAALLLAQWAQAAGKAAPAQPAAGPFADMTSA